MHVEVSVVFCTFILSLLLSFLFNFFLKLSTFFVVRWKVRKVKF